MLMNVETPSESSILPDETVRLNALKSYAVLDTLPEEAFDRLTELSAELFQVPIALVSFVDEHRQWFKSCHGLNFHETDRSLSFCAHALEADEVLVIPDATQDPRFAENPLVTGEAHFRFYAGAPLITPQGERLGTLCVLDTVPRSEFTAADQRTLNTLAASVMSELELRKEISGRRHAEAVNAAILAASLDAIFTLDDQGTITDWNAAASRLTGYDRQEVLGRSARTLVSETNGETVGEEFWNLLQEQPLHMIRRFAASMAHRDGTVFPGEVTLLTLNVEDQRVYTLTLRDLTMQEATRAELREQHNLLQAIVSSVPEMIYVKDLQRRYVLINPAGATHFGRPVSDILGRTDEQLLPKSTAAGSHLRDDEVFSSGQGLLYEVKARLPDGQLRAFWSSKTLYRDSEGKPIGLIGVSTDITERKVAEVTIRQHNAHLTQRVEQAQLEILERLARAAEYRDDDTGEHMLRVGTTAASLARALGLNDAETELVRRTAPLHDVGKIGISDTVLLKPGRLTPEEFKMVKRHSLIGAEILQGGTSLLVEMAELIARTHHERWDGSGYPEGLLGEAIPLVGRIVAVADVLDALVSERPYKQAWSLPAALAEIEAQAGRQFDPQVVQALLNLYAPSKIIQTDLKS